VCIFYVLVGILWCLCCIHGGLPTSQSLFKRLGQQLQQAPHSQQDSRVSVEAGKYTFHYVLSAGVAFLTLTDKGCELGA
jgi:hypothetical protein